MKAMTTIATLLTIIGGLNWGLYAFFNMDLVAMLLGAGSTLAQGAYGLIALSALYKGYLCFCCADHCHAPKGPSNGSGCCSR